MKSLYTSLQERKVIHTIILYLAGSWGIIEAMSFFSGRYDWPNWVFDVTLLIIICGLPFSIIRAWFHGMSGEQKMSSVEMVLLSLNAVVAISLGFVMVNAKESNVSVRERKTPIEITERSIAVLPFVNLSSDPEQVYFSDGITEDILNHLVKISDLKVKSRTSAFKYKDSKKNIFEIGQELGVRSILEGSIRKAGNMVRIVVQLIDATRDENLWSETYDRELKDVLNVQSEIALEIARALKARLTPSEESNINSRASSDITAYDYFLKARQIITISNDDRKDYEIALQLLDKAIELDPKFAAAYALKAAAWYKQSNYGVFYKTWKDSSLYYASTAIKLNPNLPDGYLVRSSVALFLKTFQLQHNFLPQNKVCLGPNNSQDHF